MDDEQNIRVIDNTAVAEFFLSNEFIDEVAASHGLT